MTNIRPTAASFDLLQLYMPYKCAAIISHLLTSTFTHFRQPDDIRGRSQVLPLSFLIIRAIFSQRCPNKNISEVRP